MSCNIVNVGSDQDVFAAAITFVERCEQSLSGHDFELVIQQPDSQGWTAYLYGYSSYGKDTVAMISRSFYHFEDTFFLSDAEESVLVQLVEEFATAISSDCPTANLHT